MLCEIRAEEAVRTAVGGRDTIVPMNIPILLLNGEDLACGLVPKRKMILERGDDVFHISFRRCLQSYTPSHTDPSSRSATVNLPRPCSRYSRAMPGIARWLPVL